ncbi:MULTISPECIES: pyrroline-5-carboxylate reductase [unclassified Wenzhouxiangella]|uniref:pyrroline-5-carboxylate reductase n=1 Tax=unclassified Wenzhouxiangella TaxID=2613841 RepID=UPI000E32D050|nr:MULTISPECIES: pyrroline-5-carboxylate reductase [unclassified Wenzhouxiangella]RFF26948.1 pyrroline-5-carboxylate reductase [Wenzhouxiangella sp. 15181]RFP69461.1 pyrroline-5-carboxylate reductase [Wenzhouxiangella sp. 15190]
MDNITISFIGGGNMGRALIGGLVAGGTRAEAIHVADPSEEQRRSLADDLGVTVHADNAEAARAADVLVVAVKPQVMDDVLDSVAEAIDADTLVISVAAGMTIDRISKGLGGHDRVVRAMPNTPALYQAGMTGLAAGEGVTDTDRKRAGQVLEAAGQVAWVDDEAQMDVVTAVSGSGPAYFFSLVEQLTAAGTRAGLPEETAAKLARQTAFGAGTMLAKSDVAAGELRRRVTSPGGTTAAALESLADNDFERIVDEAVRAAVKRGRELGEG